MSPRLLNTSAATSLIALIFLGLAWEGPLAPLKPGGSMLILKVLPLTLALFGILRGRVYTHQWASMLALVYFTEGVVRSMTDRGLSAVLAAVELALATLFFLACIFYVRAARRPAPS